MVERGFNKTEVIFEASQGARADRVIEVGCDLEVLGLVGDLGDIPTAPEAEAGAETNAEAERAYRDRPPQASRNRGRLTSLTSLIALPVCVALLGAAVPSLAHAIEPVPDRFEHLDPRPPNLFLVQATTLREFAGFDIGYRRALGRHLSLGAMLEYVYPDPGFGQTQSLGYTVEAIGWIQRPWTGVYFAANVSVGHNFLLSVPRLGSVAVGGGIAMGWSWDLPYAINLGFSAGIRRMAMVHRSSEICTLPNQCIMVREDFVPRFTLSFGYRF